MKGFNGGYITNLDGQYEINTDQPEVTLTFNYIGYKPLEKKVKNGTAGNFTMQEDVGELGEVVVTGFATKNRNSFTGSQVSIRRTSSCQWVQRMYLQVWLTLCQVLAC